MQPPHLGTLPFLIDWLHSPHPTASLPHKATLRRLTLTHPQPDLVRAVLAAVGSSDVVAVEAGDPALHARVATPLGEVALSR